MKRFIMQLITLIVAYASILLGISASTILATFAFEYCPYIIASIISVLGIGWFLLQATDIALVKLPYGIIGINSMRFFNIMATLIIIGSLFSLFNYTYFDQFNGFPKWIYILINILIIPFTLGLYRKAQDIAEYNKNTTQ